MNIGMNKFTNKYFILFIIAFAFLLRVYHIGNIPPSLSWDEVSIGYNAYSILKTGKDEHGRLFPLDAFVAYGDYKPPLSIYLTVPFIAVLGLNELSVRLPSALFGTLTVLLTYFLVKELFYKSKNYELGTKNLSLLSALLLALCPWHINLSRAGFEANIALFFVVLGIYLVFLSMRKPKVWYGALLPFVLAIYTFNSSRYFVPILGIGVLVIFWKSIRNQWKHIAVGCLIAVITLLPIMPHLFSKEARLRFAEVNIFTDSSVVLTSNRRIEDAGNVWWAKIIFNRRVGYAREYILHYLDHFQPDYLFIKGDGNPKFSIQDVGQLYIMEAPFLVIGMFGLIRAFPSIGLFLLYWLLVSIIPAATARETPHALRTLNSLPTWQIFVAYGICMVGSWIYFGQKTVNKKQNCLLLIAYCLLLLSIYIFSIGYYLHNYYRHYPIEYSGEWQYGYKDALVFIKPLEKQCDTIYMTESIGRPYMYTLFYTKTDPRELFQTKDATFDAAGFYHVYGFGKYRFVKDMPADCQGKCLFIAPAGAEGKDAKILKTIHLLNGNPILTVYEK
jgi:4-amino-4-deoxy-L-arabinose transferase-like glycosyltransferase